MSKRFKTHHVSIPVLWHPCALAGLRRGAMRSTQANELRPGIPRRGPELLRERSHGATELWFDHVNHVVSIWVSELRNPLIYLNLFPKKKWWALGAIKSFFKHMICQSWIWWGCTWVGNRWKHVIWTYLVKHPIWDGLIRMVSQFLQFSMRMWADEHPAILIDHHFIVGESGTPKSTAENAQWTWPYRDMCPCSGNK